MRRNLSTSIEVNWIISATDSPEAVLPVSGFRRMFERRQETTSHRTFPVLREDVTIRLWVSDFCRVTIPPPAPAPAPQVLHGLEATVTEPLFIPH